MGSMSPVEVESPRTCADTGTALPERRPADARNPARDTHSLPPLLNQLGVSLLVSTYQTGKVAAVGRADVADGHAGEQFARRALFNWPWCSRERSTCSSASLIMLRRPRSIRSLASVGSYTPSASPISTWNRPHNSSSWCQSL